MLGDTLKLFINNPKKLDISDISYELNGNQIENNSVLKNVSLGDKVITAKVKIGEEVETITKSITVYNNIIPAYYTYEVVNTYPHDITSYTQ